MIAREILSCETTVSMYAKELHVVKQQLILHQNDAYRYRYKNLVHVHCLNKNTLFYGQ